MQHWDRKHSVSALTFHDRRNEQVSINSFGARNSLKIQEREIEFFDLPKAHSGGTGDSTKLPVSLKVLLENLLRHEDGTTVTAEDIQVLSNWAESPPGMTEIQYRPARVLMQDFTGVPAVADLAAMRSAVAKSGNDPSLINPQAPVDLVIDHSVMVDHFGSSDAFGRNVKKEMERNQERYRFLRWGQQAFEHFRVVPPGTGICHQVNLEYLAQVVWTDDRNGGMVAYPDTLVGTDSHTTMINALGVLGWGVGGIEAEAAILGQPVSMLVPEVVGVRMSGQLSEGITATDLVLRVVERLRQFGVVGKFVEFFGPSLNQLTLADRATIANMAPEYGATCGFFPIDEETIDYLKLTARSPERVALVERYAKAQGMWRDPKSEPIFTATLDIDLSSIEPSVAGPRRPQDRVAIRELKRSAEMAIEESGVLDIDKRISFGSLEDTLGHGDVVIAAITSCTNTSNPAVMIAAGLLARNAIGMGLRTQPWVKTSLAPGSKVVTEYLRQSELLEPLSELGFDVVGYGCTTCIGNSGPLPKAISHAVADGDLMVASVLSGNRNFEGRVHQEVRANWLASPPLVVAFAIAGTTRINLLDEPLGNDRDGKPVYLRDIWPSNSEVRNVMNNVSAQMFSQQYSDVFLGPHAWQELGVPATETYGWEQSTYIRHPPFFEVGDQAEQPIEVDSARILALLGDSITTDHISPAGAIQPASPAGEYLQQQGVPPTEFNSYGSRRGNHEVMMRGTFANIRIRNKMLSGVEGGYTRHVPTGDRISIYDAAVRYQGEGIPLVVFAGKEYGTGSSRDWAAKGTRLLGVKAVIAESFERIHRSNLIGMGVLPLQFHEGDSWEALDLDGSEMVSISLPEGETTRHPRQKLKLTIVRDDGSKDERRVSSCINTENELAYFQSGGILQYVLNSLLSKQAA